MSTKMNAADWDLALEVFRACLPARGRQGKDDRLFLEALHHFTVHNSGGPYLNDTAAGIASGNGSTGSARQGCSRTILRCWRG